MQDTPEAFEDLPAADDYIGQHLWLTKGDRTSTEEAIRQKDFDGLKSSAHNKISFINESYSRAGRSAEELKYMLQCLWVVYYQVGKNVPYSSPEQDTWVLHIVQVRGQGNLTRRAQSSLNVDDGDNYNNNNKLEIATTSAGTIWEDLPFFTADMTDFWVKDCATMSAAQRANFSHFLAKLASAGVDDNLCGIALLVFIDAFETVRSLGSLADQSHEDPHRALHDLTIAALLPAAQAWLHIANNKIVQLSDKLRNNFATVKQDDSTFTKSELGRRSSAVFSPWRWMYWLKRLEEIKEEAS
ncbi:hypothetical protein THAR02_00812 [Trichoderma harzianum]|uniref:Uncharacterized protein n=1 Tax=Trichoderma harzianum TaxID=5544 RepID=A0A0F9Y4V8_TRIHA|nr:hypothetical protein THAR02_00812 [Trichoderma harzianum]